MALASLSFSSQCASVPTGRSLFAAEFAAPCAAPCAAPFAAAFAAAPCSTACATCHCRVVIIEIHILIPLHPFIPHTCG